jgi:hypothetical protein
MLILVIPSLAFVYTQRVSQPIDVEIDENGIAIVKIVVDVDEGVSGVVLPIEPIPLTIDIEITPSVPGVEWLYENNTLYIVSSEKTTLTVTYIANTSIENGVVSIKVETNNIVKLVLAPNILLLTLPENIINISTLPGNKLEIIFTGSTTISYTITQTTPTATPTTTPISTLTTSPTPTAIISTPSPNQTTLTQTPRTPTPVTPSIITSTTPIQSLTTPVSIATTISTPITPTTPTTTLPQTLSTPKGTAIPIDIVIIAIVIIIIIVAIILTLRRR